MDKCILMRFARDIDIIFKNEIYSLVVESIPFALIGCST